MSSLSEGDIEVGFMVLRTEALHDLLHHYGFMGRVYGHVVVWSECLCHDKECVRGTNTLRVRKGS
jgi:hypothetical protein